MEGTKIVRMKNIRAILLIVTPQQHVKGCIEMDISLISSMT